MRVVVALLLVAGCGAGPEGPVASCDAIWVDPPLVRWIDARLDHRTDQVLTVRSTCAEPVALDLSLQGDSEPFSLRESQLVVPPGGAVPVVVTFLGPDYLAHEATLRLTEGPAPVTSVGLAGWTDPDQDGDGFVAAAAGGNDCDDLQVTAHPGAGEIWYDGIDQDCLGGDDFDRDGDGFQAPPWGGDCDDTDLWVHEAAPEQDNGVDDDCDVLIDEDFVVPGDVLVTELMVTPTAVPDERGEYVELRNTSSRRIDLVGWTLSDADGEQFTIPDSLVVEPGRTVVLAPEANPSANGGMRVDLQVPRVAFQLDRPRDEVLLDAGGVRIAEVRYSEGLWGIAAGTAIGLDPMRQAPATAGDRNNWCPASSLLPRGDRGTPNAINDWCPQIDHDGDGVPLAEDCDDTSASTWPDAPEAWNGIDDDCDGVIDDAIVDDVAAARLDGDPGEALGSRTVGAGDLDGDGVVELVIAGAELGGAWVLDGAGAASWSGHPSAQDVGNVIADELCAVGPVLADVSGDGLADLVLAGPGVAVLSWGSGGALDPDDDAVARWTSDVDDPTTAVVSHADLDGDGVADIAVGSRGHGAAVAGEAGRGAVWVLVAEGVSGDASLADAEAVLTGGTDGDGLGRSIAAGDFDGDGTDDLLVGAPAVDGNGALYLVPADAISSAEAPDVAMATVLGGTHDDWLGGATATLADLDGTGSLDLVVGAPGSGVTWVFLDAGDLAGEIDTSDADARIEYDTVDNLGRSMATTDVDGDGTVEVLVGAPDAMVLGTTADQSGAVWTISGTELGAGASTTERDAIRSALGGALGDRLGWSLLVADLDGNGIDDLVVGAPGRATGAGALYVVVE